MSRRNRRVLSAAAILLGSALAMVAPRADTLVLIPGYLGVGDDWRESGVTTPLVQAGWHDGGNLPQSWGWVPATAPAPQGGHRFYALDLETEAPLLYQERQLADMVALVQARHPGQALILAGHSAGGVLARLYMVRHPDQPVSALITIASPHLGTESAELGAQAGRTPLGWLSGLLGEPTLNRSQGLYLDLARERPGTLLYWLNRQQHPDARYISVVRNGRDSWFGDLVVEAWSQDMNGVYALQGRALRLQSGGGHGLEAADGQLIVRILARLAGG